MSEVEVYLVRHAEAAGADGDDPGISEHGRSQAKALGQRLAGTRFAAAFHSPRRRAAETAAILFGARPDVPTSPCEPVDDRTPVPSAHRRDDYPKRYWPWLEATPPAERDQDAARLSDAVSQLAAAAGRVADDGPLLVVTHAFVIGWFVRSALDAPIWRWIGLSSANTGLSVIRYTTDGAALVTFNDTGHLGLRTSWSEGLARPSWP
jgi:serine/threonine-protein phosphatase PGAM5